MRIRVWQLGLFALVMCLVIFLGKTANRSPRRSHGSMSANDTEFVTVPTPGAFNQSERIGNVILISIDTLRADHMSLHGYHRQTTPNIDRFARECRVFDRAYSTSPFTAPSMVSMLSGLYPNRHGVRLLWQKIEPDLVVLPDLFQQAGFQTTAVVSNLLLSHRAIGWGDRFDDYDETMQASFSQRPEMVERNASATTDAALSWLRNEKEPGRPFFLWVHYIDPHGPYTPPIDKPVDYSHLTPQIVPPEMIPRSVREPDLLDGLEYVDRYDEEIAYVDLHIGRLIDQLRKMDLLDNSITVITADHGEHLLDGNGTYFSHGFDVRDATVRIPLLIHGGGIPVQREAQPVSICDVMPTVLAATGIQIPTGIDGRSLLGDISRRPPYVEGPDSGGSGGLHRAFVFADRKVIVQHGRSNIPRRAWAFESVADPLELAPLPVDEFEPAYQVLAQIILDEPHPGGIPDEFRDGTRPSTLMAKGADRESIDALRAFGYVK